jgi:hypothetical protein
MFVGHSPLSMSIIFDIVLALSKRVPQLDRPVARSGNNLPVIGAEADTKNVGGVANKAASGGSGVQVPETERVVPR